MSEKITADSEHVEISKLKHHPLNPRIGNIEVIAESLSVNGQYKPVTVQKSTRLIVAGNHTVKAARALGWTKIGVSYIDVSDAEALEILLADNKSSDNSLTDEDAAFVLLASLPSLRGTGYTAEDLNLPEPEIDMPDTPPAPKTETAEEPATELKPVAFQIGSAKGFIKGEEFKEWRAGLPKKTSEAVAEVLDRLGLVEKPVEQREGTLCGVTERVPLGQLVNYPGNPQQGDVGALMNLLERHGQYKPITVNRRNFRILAGNHVAIAADRLGWTEIDVSWVDVDAEAEKRIVLVDNRSSALATYDMAALGRAISGVDPRNILATGFTLEDLDAVGHGEALKIVAGRLAEATVNVGGLKAKVRLSVLRDANFSDGQELVEGAAMLGIDPGAVVVHIKL